MAPSERGPDEGEDRDQSVAEDVLAAFNAEGVIDHPGRPTAEEPNPAQPDDAANDADWPVP